jgi:ankyrin repeat protein
MPIPSTSGPSAAEIQALALAAWAHGLGGARAARKMLSTALSIAAKGSDVENVGALIRAGGDPCFAEVVDREPLTQDASAAPWERGLIKWSTPWLEALLANESETFAALLAGGVHPLSQAVEAPGFSAVNASPLAIAAWLGHAECVEAALRKARALSPDGSWMGDGEDLSRDICLCWDYLADGRATPEQALSIARSMASAGVDLDATSAAWGPACAIDRAVSYGNEALAFGLIQAGADLNVGWPAWTAATSDKADAGFLQRLLQAGADPFASRDEASGLLGEVLKSSDPDLSKARVLIGAGCDVNAKNDWGVPLLMLAAGRESAQAVALLLAHGADPDAVDRQNSNALDKLRAREKLRAQSISAPEIFEMIQAASQARALALCCQQTAPQAAAPRL